jgi:acetolactate synthase-1/3 small subunit
MITKHLLTAIVENEPNVLARVAGQMGRRSANIEYFSAHNLSGGQRTRIMIGFAADECTAERIAKGIGRLINVLDVECESRDWPEDPATDRRSEPQ